MKESKLATYIGFAIKSGKVIFGYDNESCSKFGLRESYYENGGIKREELCGGINNVCYIHYARSNRNIR